MAGATYWTGQDGNIYFGSGMEGTPVQNLGNIKTGGAFTPGEGGLYDNFTDDGVPRLTYAAQRIDDPSAPAPTPSAPSGGGGGTAARVAPVLDQKAADNTQQTIDQLPALLRAALSAESTTFNNTKNAFNTQEATERANYDRSTQTNQGNYDSNMMDSVRAGSKGLSGLMQILRGTGAEGWAQDAVGSQTSQDIRTGLDTREQNQTSVDNALGSFLTGLKGKKQQNKDAFTNNKRAIQRGNDTQLQELFGKMAGYYGDAEMTSQRNNWMDKAGALTPSIAQNSMSKVSNYDQTPVSVKAPEITAFSNPTEKNIGYSGGNGQVGSGIFTMAKPDERKREREANAPVGV